MYVMANLGQTILFTTYSCSFNRLCTLCDLVLLTFDLTLIFCSTQQQGLPQLDGTHDDDDVEHTTQSDATIPANSESCDASQSCSHDDDSNQPSHTAVAPHMLGACSLELEIDTASMKAANLKRLQRSLNRRRRERRERGGANDRGRVPQLDGHHDSSSSDDDNYDDDDDNDNDDDEKEEDAGGEEEVRG